MERRLAEVHTLYTTNCGDIPSMLRQAADSIETEEAEGYSPTRAIVAVQIAENGEIQLYGWGKTDTMHSIALLNLGAAKLVQQSIVDSE